MKYVVRVFYFFTIGNGACVQCPAKDCLKSYHPECARSYGIFMGHSYNAYPFWRIYCEDHAELAIKQRFKKAKNSLHNQLLKFCRALNRTADLHEDITSIPVPKRVTFKRPPPQSGVDRSRGRKVNPEDNDRQNKLIEAFLCSFYSNNNLNSSQQFTINLRRDPNGGFEVASISIPPPDDEQTDEEETALGKRNPKTISPEVNCDKKKRRKKPSNICQEPDV